MPPASVSADNRFGAGYSPRVALAALLSSVFLLAGCGAGTSTQSSSQTLGGFAIDGLIADAEVRCLDAAGKTLKTVRTASNGAWILRERNNTLSCASLEVYDGVDVGTNPADPSERSTLPPGTRFTASLTHLDIARLGNAAIIISPLTTLIHAVQTRTGLSHSQARGIVLSAMGVPSSFDPLFENPISLMQPNSFGAGVLAATAIRETSTGILDAIAHNPNVSVSLELRRRVHQVVTESLAELMRSGTLNRASLTTGQPTDASPIAQLVQVALNRLQADTAPVANPVAGLQFDTVRTIVAQYAGRAGAQLEGATAAGELSPIAQRAALLNTNSQSDVQRPQLLQKLATESSLNLTELATAVRALITNPASSLTITKTNGAASLEIELSTTLKDYLQVANEQLRVYTTSEPQTGRTISVGDFEFGTAPPVPGALSAVALSFTQPSDSRLLSVSAEKTVQLGFRVERVDPLGALNIRLAAIVDGVRLRWSENGLVARTADDSVLYGAARIGSSAEDTPITLANTNNRLAAFVTTDNGLLRIDLAALLTALGLNPDAVLQSYLSNSTLTVEAMISDVVFARGQNASLRKLGAISVSVPRGTGQSPLNSTGAGLRGTVITGN